jgi:ABC-2 type transport system permease protein
VVTDLLRSELRKTFTVKLWWVMGLAPLAVGVLAGSFSLAVLGSGAGGEDLGGAGFSSVIGLFTALYFLLMFAAMFGALNSSGEHRHKTITTTFLTTSSRGRSLAAKLAVSALVGMLYAVGTEIVTIALIALVSDGPLPGVDGQVVGFLLVAVAVTVLWTLLGAGLGTVLASSVGSSVGIVVYYLLGELLVSALLSSAGADQVSKLLPQQATLGALAGVLTPTDGTFLPWWGGLLALAGWAAALCTGGWALNRVRDVG